MYSSIFGPHQHQIYKSSPFIFPLFYSVREEDAHSDDVIPQQPAPQVATAIVDTNPFAGLVSKINYFRSISPPTLSAAEAATQYLNKEKPMPEEFGSIGRILNNMPNSDQIIPSLERQGITLSEIESQLKQGRSPFEILSGMSTMPNSAKAALMEIQTKVDEYKGKPAVQVSLTQSSPKDTKPNELAVTANMLSQMGAKGHSITDGINPSGDTDSELGGDIWHPLWKDSIFELVSLRIKKVQLTHRDLFTQ